MTNGSDRLDRIERILEEVGLSLKQVARRQEEMAIRQQHHDEAFERRKAEMKTIREAIAADSENIQALLRAELRHRRPDDLEGGGAV
ncbi:MAG TPA: hypothetical protein VGR73_13190 [Bryobacteraceae bacterium]|nr:hypothetical protein [Bryobacteraceae bacterium]